MTPEGLAEQLTGEPCPLAVRVHGAEPALPGPFLVVTAAAACVGVATAAAGAYHAERGGSVGAVSVDVAHAAESFRSERHLAVDGEAPAALWSGLSGNYRTRDGWVRLHANYPHHADAVRRTLDATDRDGLEAAALRRTGQDIEDAVVEQGGAAAVLRTRQEWLEHEQGAALAELPLIDFRRIGPTPAVPRPAGARPLAGVRVLDLTHVIAGPVCTRVLAAHGADVLRIDAEHLPALDSLLLDTGFGKRSANLDLRTADGRETLRGLVAGADVVVQSYRPGALAAKGFGPENLAALRPGIVAVDLHAYGWNGPWALRRGFDSLVQCSTGIAAYAGTDEPRPLPAQALDHGTGWLAAFAVITALRRRLTEGGSWWLRLALARTGRWLDSLGRKTPQAPWLDSGRCFAETDTPFGRVRHVRVPGDIEGCRPYWAHGPHQRGADEPRWL